MGIRDRLQAFGGKDDDPEESVELEEFLKEFAVRDPKEQKQHHPFWPSGRLVKSDAAERLYLKGQVFTALGCMGTLIEDYFSPAEAVLVMVKPNRTVVAAKAFQISALVLGPDTNTVKDLKIGKDEMPEKGLEAVFKPANPKFRFFLEAPKGSELCSPAYLVATTEDSKKANVVWSTVSVASLVGFDFVGKQRPKICGPRGEEADEPSPEAINKHLVVHLPVLINIKPPAGPGVDAVLPAAAEAGRESRCRDHQPRHRQEGEDGEMRGRLLHSGGPGTLGNRRLLFLPELSWLPSRRCLSRRFPSLR